MKSAEAKSIHCRLCWLGLLPWLLAGCATCPTCLDDNVQARPEGTQRAQNVASSYLLGCPDVLELTIEARPDISGRQEIDPEGRIHLGALGDLRVEGKGVEEISRRVAELLEVPPSRVQVRMVDYRSQRVFIFGQVVGRQRSVPYRGQETVLELLQHEGGITPGASADDIHVVRSQIPRGEKPQVFHVDLDAILADNEQATNIRLQPSDEIFIGESWRSRLEKFLPRWFHPLYERMVGLHRLDRSDGRVGTGS